MLLNKLCNLNGDVYNKLMEPVKGTLAEINTGDPFFYTKTYMDGHKETKFHWNLIDLLDKVFLHNGLRFLSVDQERVMIKFFNEAGIVTDKINKGDKNPYDQLNEPFNDLDNFLGSYIPYDRR